jgi:hypothetical protein
VTQLALNLISSGAELLYRPAHPAGKLGELFRAEQEEHDEEDDHHVRPRKIQDTGDRWSHKNVSSKQHTVLNSFNQFGGFIFPENDPVSRRPLISEASPTCIRSFLQGNGIKRDEGSLY